MNIFAENARKWAPTLSLTLTLLASYSMAYAMAADNLNTSTMTTRLFPSSLEKNKPHTEAELRVENIQYMTPLKNAPDLDQSQFVSARLSYAGKNSAFENVADLGVAAYVSPGETHWLVQELYTTPQTQGLTGDLKISLGRRKSAWSVMDANWDLGVWQPYYEIDTLRPEQQGLTGAFFDFDQENFQVLGFATPLFIPNMGPVTSEKDGSLVTQSRWIQTPPKEAGLGGNVNPLNYKLSVPEAGEMILHEGYAVMARLGRPEQGPWISGSAGYKPVNQLLIARSLRNMIATHESRVVIAPQVTYHTVLALDTGYSLGSSGVTLSYLQDSPKEQRPQDGWAIQKLSPLQAFAAGIYWQVPALMTRSVVLKLDYLKARGGEVEDIVIDGTRDDLSNDQQRLKFTDAIRLRGQAELARIYHRPLLMQLSWLYDRDQRGSMLNSEFKYFPGTQWAILLGADFLGVDDDSQSAPRFLSQYRANDRVYGGMTYVF